jgi:hypothetical protein
MELTLELSEKKWPAPAKLRGIWEDNLAALLRLPLVAALGGARLRLPPVQRLAAGGCSLPPCRPWPVAAAP